MVPQVVRKVNFLDHGNLFMPYKHLGLLKAADRAMNALRGVRRGMTGQRGGRKRLKSELASAFSSYSKKKKTCAWKHRFVCLGLRDQPRIPTTDVERTIC